MNDLQNSATHLSRRTRTKPPKMVARRFRRFLVPLLILLLIIASVVGVQHLFVVRTIDCKMDDQQCTDPVMAELARLRGKSMFFVETADLKDKLHAALPKSQTIEFEKQPPQTMQVFITSYPSAFIIHSGAQYLLANEGGTLIELVESFPQTELDVVVPNANMQVGETIDAPVFSALLQLTQELKKSSLVVLSVEYIDENQIVYRRRRTPEFRRLRTRFVRMNIEVDRLGTVSIEFVSRAWIHSDPQSHQLHGLQ